MSAADDPSSPDEGDPKPPDEGVYLDRRSRQDRRKGERRRKEVPVEKDRRSGEDRRKGPRRRKRSINQYDMTPDELEFVNAVNRFRRDREGRFPTARDLLQILRDLGYEKRDD